MSVARFPVFAGPLDPEGWCFAKASSGGGIAIAPKGERAYLDICAHRAAAILAGGSQSGMTLVCPYHGWAFGPDGKARRGNRNLVLAVAERLGPTLMVCDSSDYRPAERMEALKALFSDLSPYLTCALRRTYTVRSHWSFWVENFLECMHCAINHPQLSAVEAFIDAVRRGAYAEMATMYQRARKHYAELFGSELVHMDWNPAEMTPSFFDVNLMSEKHPFATPDGEPVGPSVWSDGRELPFFIYGAVGPLAHFTLYSDYVFLTSFLPMGPDETEINCQWLTANGAQCSDDKLAWLWDATMRQDIELVERLHIGRTAPGSFSPVFDPIESQAAAFHDWLGRIGLVHHQGMTGA